MISQNISSLYTSIEKAKNDSFIPVLYNGKTLESKYNPDKEAENLLQESYKETHFFIVTGICSGIFIQKLIDYSPNSFILCIERTEQDIVFLKQLSIVQKLSQNKQIFFATSDNLFESMINHYLPAKYGKVQIIERKTWLQENQDLIITIQEKIQKAIGIVSADYSVQVHFGKIWQNNILNNLKSLIKNEKNLIKNSDFLIKKQDKFNLKKTVYLIAAGPTLENQLAEIKEDSSAFIITTDTSYSTLLKNNIIPDVVISIDGQAISSNHFIINHPKNTLFLFDLCSNHSAINTILEQQGNICFFKSGHPFCEFLNIYENLHLPTLFSGSGTVTIAALDFALKCGFSKIKVLGADFGYYEHKPYVKGTYFESLFNKNSNKLNPQETNYSKLMYRTELFMNQNKKTTKVLQAYQDSFEKYIIEKNCKFTYENFIYTITNPSNENQFFSKSTKTQSSDFSNENFIQKLKKKLLSIEQLEIPLLPYIAHLKQQNPTEKYENLLKLAYSNIVSYNI